MGIFGLVYNPPKPPPEPPKGVGGGGEGWEVSDCPADLAEPPQLVLNFSVPDIMLGMGGGDGQRHQRRR